MPCIQTIQVLPAYLKLLERIMKQPYEITWNCSHIPDQNYGKLSFYCRVYDNAGNVSRKALGEKSEGWSQIVLDREPVHNPMKITSHRVKNITVDGDLSEWNAPDSLVFKNNDNTICVYSLWNDENVFNRSPWRQIEAS